MAKFISNFWKSLKKIKFMISLVTVLASLLTLISPGDLDLQNHVIERGYILEDYKGTREKVWVFLSWQNNNYSAYAQRYANMSYHLIMTESYYFRNPSILYMYLGNQYRIKVPFPNATVRIIETEGIECEVTRDIISVRAQKPSIVKDSRSFLRIEYEVSNYRPNVTVFLRKLHFSDILEIIATFHNNENFDIEHYWWLLNISLSDLPLFTGYNIYNLTYFDVSSKGEVIVPYRVFMSNSFSLLTDRLLLPIGFILEAKSSKTVVIVIKNGEPGSIVIWGPMGPPLGLGAVCFPYLNRTGAYYQWVFWETRFWPDQLPFNVLDIKIIGNRKVIMKIIPNNNTAADKVYRIGLRGLALVRTVWWSYNELRLKEEKIIEFDIDLSGCSHIVIEILKE